MKILQQPGSNNFSRHQQVCVSSDTNLLVPWEVVVIMSSQQDLSLKPGSTWEKSRVSVIFPGLTCHVQKSWHTAEEHEGLKKHHARREERNLVSTHWHRLLQVLIEINVSTWVLRPSSGNSTQFPEEGLRTRVGTLISNKQPVSVSVN